MKWKVIVAAIVSTADAFDALDGALADALGGARADDATRGEISETHVANWFRGLSVTRGRQSPVVQYE